MRIVKKEFFMVFVFSNFSLLVGLLPNGKMFSFFYKNRTGGLRQAEIKADQIFYKWVRSLSYEKKCFWLQKLETKYEKSGSDKDAVILSTYTEALPWYM